MPFGEGGYRTSFWPTDREMRRPIFDFHFPKFQNLELARGLANNFFQNQRRGGVRFLASEFTTSNGGRIDTLGLDENGCPDWSSHTCDAFGLMAVVYEEPPVRSRHPNRRDYSSRPSGRTHWSA